MDKELAPNRAIEVILLGIMAPPRRTSLFELVFDKDGRNSGWEMRIFAVDIDLSEITLLA